MRYSRTSVLRRKRSGAIAAKRLKSLLAADQTGFPPEVLEMLKDDLFRVISRYMDADASRLELFVRRSDETASEEEDGCPAALYTVIPVRSLRLKGTIA